MLLARKPVQFPQLVQNGVNPDSSARKEKVGHIDLLSISSVKRMAITPKSSPPKKIVVSPPSPANSGTNQKKVRETLFGAGDSPSRQSRVAAKISKEFGLYGVGDRKMEGNKCHSPVRRHSASMDRLSIEEVVRNNLKTVRGASSSANAKERRFNVDSVTRTAINTMQSSSIRASIDGAVSNYENEVKRPKSTQYGAESTQNSIPYYSSKLKRSGIPRSMTMKCLDKASSSSCSHEERKGEDSSKVSAGPSSLAPWSARGTRSSTSDFQAACKARVLKKQKELIVRLKEQSLNESEGITETSRQESARLRREEAAIREKDKHRKRKEIYAVNAYLKQQEQRKFQLFLSQQKKLEARATMRGFEESGGSNARDDISWCSNDSSMMPTPRYRNERERNYHAENSRKFGESSASESDSERSGCDQPRLANPLRQSVGGGV